MSSTETGVIFGNIVYDAAGQLDRNVVVLNDIHIDIMDYISPASCADVAFRNMWAEFEWENKVRTAPARTDADSGWNHARWARLVHTRAEPFSQMLLNSTGCREHQH